MMSSIKMVLVLTTITLSTYAQPPQNDPHPLVPARILAQNGDYPAAISVFENVRNIHPEAISPLDGDQFGAVYAVARDYEGVQDHARWMFKKFPLPQRIENAERTAKSYLTYPESANKEIAAHALKFTTFAAENAGGQWVNWFYTAHALALYRNGKYNESIEWARKSVGDQDPKLTSFALPIQAMSEYAIGNKKAARNLLRQAQVDFDELPLPGTPEYAESWSDILTSKSVIEEARRKLN